MDGQRRVVLRMNQMSLTRRSGESRNPEKLLFILAILIPAFAGMTRSGAFLAFSDTLLRGNDKMRLKNVELDGYFRERVPFDA